MYVDFNTDTEEFYVLDEESCEVGVLEDYVPVPQDQDIPF